MSEAERFTVCLSVYRYAWTLWILQ